MAGNKPDPTTQESDILQSYLLAPSTLPTILTLTSFTTLFPSQCRTHPHIRALYRDLQFQRSVDVDGVRENIERECSRGEGMRRQLGRDVARELSDGVERVNGRKRRRVGDATDTDIETTTTTTEDDPDADVEIDILLDTAFLPSNPDPTNAQHDQNYGMVPRHTLSSSSTHHTLPSLLSAMERACQDLEAESSSCVASAEKILTEMSETVGALSDMRYGQFAREGSEGPEEEVVKALEGLAQTCDGKAVVWRRGLIEA